MEGPRFKWNGLKKQMKRDILQFISGVCLRVAPLIEGDKQSLHTNEAAPPMRSLLTDLLRNIN